MSGFNFNRKLNNRGSLPVIQIAPFVDVVLVLLIIFMITTPIMVTGMDVSLPEGGENVNNLVTTDPLTITINNKNVVFIEDQIVLLPNLLKSIKLKTRGDLDKKIFIRSDKDVQYGNVMSLINTLNKAGYKKTILVTEDV